MHRIFLLGLIFCFNLSFGQRGIRKHVKQHLSRISSISNDNDYSGFEAIVKAIGDKRVVMLGEQDHGDATAFIAKTKIIKYLHEKKGFNVLAFESDFFSLTEGQKQINSDTGHFIKYMQENIFPIWTFCHGCKELFYEYLPQTLFSQQPITVTGFDSQLHGSYARQHYPAFIDSALKTLMGSPPGFDNIAGKIAAHADSLMRYYGRQLPDTGLYDSASVWLSYAVNEWVKQKGKDFVWRLLNSLRGFNQQAADRNEEYNIQNAARDEQMADNLDWLVNEKYKNEKIIVWAASAHIIKNVNAIMKNHFRTMGTIFCNKPGNAGQTYVVGFTSATGTTGRLAGGFKPYALSKPDSDSFEKWFEDADYAFVDLLSYHTGTEKPEAFKMKGINHLWNGHLQWSRSYDGIFYISKMEPCAPIVNK